MRPDTDTDVVADSPDRETLTWQERGAAGPMALLIKRVAATEGEPVPPGGRRRGTPGCPPGGWCCSATTPRRASTRGRPGVFPPAGSSPS
ncbi:hypothetical protein FE391_12625 [Nonomuraea sp. KC401]|uniref:hypothetical protein n=1 Tax=unclassified Nonomuraea TaxID=2593643 RepID=UPI0010FEFC86|nr:MULTISPECIES: hypothetical protein [unclassified Nonomuraea]NBE94656.1 hypothetical protein [Nonomuraea sp. K271]TLF76156.1 hypothetical protein FE391_12625 [Nonomuraea sp. KC401]